MSSDAPDLERSIRAHFAPNLRSAGFKGSGRTFRRVRGDLIEIVNFQGSRYGGMFAINLAVHPVGVRALADTPEKAIKEYECAFRARLSETQADQWWPTGVTQESMDKAVLDAARVYQANGAPLFDRVGGGKSPLNFITPEALASNTFDAAGFASVAAHMALILMRWRLEQGRSEEAKGFARALLQDCRDDFFWRAEFEAVLAS